MSRSRRRRRSRRSFATRRWVYASAAGLGAIALASAAFAFGAFNELYPSDPAPIAVAGAQPVAPEVGALSETVHLAMVDTTLSDQAQLELLPRRFTQLAVIAASDDAQLYLSAGDADPATTTPVIAAGDFRSDGVDSTEFASHLARTATEFSKSAVIAVSKRPAAPVTSPTAELRALAAQAQRARADGAKRVVLTLIGSAIATEDSCNFTVSFGAVAPDDEAAACLAAAAATGQPLDLTGLTVRLAGVGANTDGPSGIAEYTTAVMLDIVRQAHGTAVVIDLDGGPIGVGG